MSLRMTVQMDWLHHATYSTYHPDNLNKQPNKLPDPVKGPAPLCPLTKYDRTVLNGWGHRLCSEKAFGPSETTTRIKENVTPKVGSTWRATMHIERGFSTSQSAMYGGSFREPSFEELVEMRSKKG